MKFLRLSVPFMVAILVFQGCQKDKTSEINGKINQGNGKWVYIEEITPEQNILIDSAQIDEKGAFGMKTTMDSPKFIRLKTAGKEFLFLVLHPGENVLLEGDYGTLGTEYKLSGSYESELLRNYMKQFKFAFKQKRAIANSFYERTSAGEDVEAVRNDLIEKHKKIKEEIREYTQHFVAQNKCALASLFVLDLQLGPNDPILTMQYDMEYFRMVDSCLAPKFPQLETVQAFNQSLMVFSENQKNLENQKVKIGEEAPNIALPNPQGDTVELYAYKGKYILLDFWASWNKTCRDNNKALLQLHELYQQKGFEIYQVSIDRSREPWVRAIENDKLPWANVCDFQFWDTYAVKLYNVYTIPSNFLIGPNGEIIGINYEIESLKQQLATIFM
jgi:peroxiredoxin